MKKLLYILLALLLSSCGIFKKVHKESTLDRISTTSIAKSDSTGLTVDKSVITIKEKADSTIIIPEKTTEATVDFNMDSLVNGMTAVQNNLIDIRFTLNPVTNKLTTIATIKPQAVSFLVSKETIKKSDITSQSAVNKSSEVSADELHKANVVDKKPFDMFWLFAIVIVVVAIIVFALYKRSGGK